MFHLKWCFIIFPFIEMMFHYFFLFIKMMVFLNCRITKTLEKCLINLKWNVELIEFFFILQKKSIAHFLLVNSSIWHFSKNGQLCTQTRYLILRKLKNLIFTGKVETFLQKWRKPANVIFIILAILVIISICVVVYFLSPKETVYDGMSSLQRNSKKKKMKNHFYFSFH